MSPHTPEERDAASHWPFLAAVGSLIWAATTTRYDCAHAVFQAARFMAKGAHGLRHWRAVKHVLAYLRGNPDRPLVLGGTSPLVLRGYVDANHRSSAPDEESCRPTTGWVFKLGDSVISWSSRTQRNVSHSPTESEIVAADDAVREAVYLRKILAEIDPKFTQKGPTPIYCDSEGCCKVSKNPVFRKRLKHLPMRLHYLRERARAGDVKLVWIKGDDNPADAFTKNLAKGPFEKHMATLSGSKRVRWAE